MTPENTKNTAQMRRRRDAWKSVIITTVWQMLAAAVLLFLRQRYFPEGILNILLLIAALLDMGMIIPVWILLKVRLKEIEGGEEDAAAQY